MPRREGEPARETLRGLLLGAGAFSEGAETLPRDRYDFILATFHLAPSSKRRIAEVSGAECYGLGDAVPSHRAWGEQALRLVRPLVETGPRHRGEFLREYLTEDLYWEALPLSLALHAAGFLEKLREAAGARRVSLDCRVPAPQEECLRLALRGTPAIELTSSAAPASSSPGLPARVWRRLRETAATGRWTTLASNAVEWSDRRLLWRSALGARRPAAPPPPGGIAFFSSDAANSRTFTAVAPLLPAPAHAVLMNGSARDGLPSAITWNWLWRFAPAGDSIPEDLEPAAPSDPLLQRWSEASPTLRGWDASQRALLRRATACWERYLDSARPRLVVVANQWGIEGWFLRVAKRRGIPAVQLLHGLLDAYVHTQTPLEADALIVWSEALRGLFPEETRGRVLVCRPPAPAGASAAAPPRRPRTVTFFSQPIREDLFCAEELIDGFNEILHGLAAAGVPLAIRFHPREDPKVLLGRWRKRYGPLPPELRLSFREPLGPLLSETAVALAYPSTVVLDCFARGIPTIVPGWWDYEWRRFLGGFPGAHLARDFRDAGEAAARWIKAPPTVAAESAALVAPPRGTGEEEFRRLVARLMA